MDVQKENLYSFYVMWNNSVHRIVEYLYSMKIGECVQYQGAATMEYMYNMESGEYLFPEA